MLRIFAQHAYAREMAGSTPEVVAKVVHRALSDHRPRTRYQAGKDAKLLVTLPRILPNRLLDTIRMRILGLPSKFGALAAASHRS